MYIYIYTYIYIMYIGLPWLSDKECKIWGFYPWVGKIPWRRKWQPTSVFLPGKSHGQRSLAGYSPWGPKKSWTWFSNQTITNYRYWCKMISWYQREYIYIYSFLYVQNFLWKEIQPLNGEKNWKRQKYFFFGTMWYLYHI